MEATTTSTGLAAVRAEIERACRDASRDPAGVTLVAVSKTFGAEAIEPVIAAGQRVFGENRVQEAKMKWPAITARHAGIELHMIGPLQSNKCRDVAEHFDWLQSLDREKLVAGLNRFRADDQPPLNVLIQVNIDDEASKSGCAPDRINALARTIDGASRLQLRGLMAIPEPGPDMDKRRRAFQRMRALFEALRAQWPSVDTLSMGMSDDFELAIEEGATMVRLGTAVFGKRKN